MAECLQMSLSDGTCQMAWEDSGFEDRKGNQILLWDSENYLCDPHDGYCNAEGWEFPGNACTGFQANWGDEYCGRSGELKWECECEECLGEYCPDCQEMTGNCTCNDPEEEE